LAQVSKSLIGEKLGIRAELLQRRFAGEEEDAIGIENAVFAEARYRFALFGRQHDVVAGNHRRVAVEIGQETPLLVM
jgi:hypothetical protein